MYFLLQDRNELGDFIRSASTMQLPNCGANQHIIDFEVSSKLFLVD